ncbi:MAG: hypothetical protein LBE04_03200 [Prevotellaceae bacterium]|jgi:hypothetical protein|nr:hypothetical protein [Prevotellaceae bacterium]
MRKVLDKFLLIFLVMPVLYSCINNNYDLDDIDDSVGLSPAITLPIGTIRTGIIDFIEGAGISGDILVKTTDTLYIVYNGSMSLSPSIPLFDYVPSDIIYFNNLPPEMPPSIQFGFGEGAGSVDIDVFKDLEANGNVLRPSDPRIYCTIRNYLGVDIGVDINGISSYGVSSYGNDTLINAVFGNGVTSHSIDVGTAPEPGKYAERKEVFNKKNGGMNRLFLISPEHLSFDFRVDLDIPDDGFIVKDQYIDVDYKVEIPMTFAKGTQLSYADTLDFDLSGEDFISNLDELRLWIGYENSLRMSVSLEVLFLDNYKKVVSNIEKKEFKMEAAKKGTHTLSFKQSEFEDAKKASYIVLKSAIKTDDNSVEVNIHPLDSISLKLSAYAKINILN